MKIAKNKLSQKILIVMCAMLMLFNFAAPAVKADDEEEGGTLAEPIMKFVTFLGDGAMNLMQKIFLGNANAITRTLSDNPDLVLLGVTITYDYIYKPNYLISPQKIFSGEIPAFDINFFTPADSHVETVAGNNNQNINTLQEYVNEFSENSESTLGYSWNPTKVNQYLARTGLFGTSVGPLEKALKNMKGLNNELDEKIDRALENIKRWNNESQIAEKQLIAKTVFYDVKVILNYINIEEVNESTTIEKKSSAAELQSTVSYWYNVLRNIAIIGLLSVLVYIGIRIVIASSASDKSKYKEMIKDWVVALCLLFFMHYFMNFVVTVTGSIASALGEKINETTIIQPDTGIEYTGDQLMGDIRIRSQMQGNIGTQMAYTLIYIVLVMYTLIFALMYLKRVIYMAFITIIAPLVALTYPLDKIRDGKAQAFDLWLKEYIFNALIQPFHLIIYYLVIGTTIDLAVNNPLYALVAIGFMLPAEKLLRKFFGFNKSETSGALGGMFGGALVMQGINALTRRVKGAPGPKGGKAGAEQSGKERNKPIRTADSGHNTSSLMSEIASENSGTNESDNLIRTAAATQSANSMQTRQNNRNATGTGNATQTQQNGNTMSEDTYDDEIVGFGQISEDENDDEDYNPYTGFDEEGNLIGSEDRPISTVDIDSYDEDDPAIDEYGNPVGFGKIYEDKNDEDEEKFWNEDRKRIAGAIGGTALRYTGKAGLAALKLAAKGTAAATLGTIGVAAGLASEDYSNVLKYGAAGVVAGNMVAKSAINRLPSSAYRVKTAVEQEREKFEQEAYSKDARKQKANKRADHAFLMDEHAIKRYSDEFKGEDYRKVMQDALKYREYGITDDDTIIKAMKLKTKGLSKDDRADKRRILVAKTAAQLNRKDVDSFGDRLIANRFSQRDAETMKQAIRDFNDWE